MLSPHITLVEERSSWFRKWICLLCQPELLPCPDSFDTNSTMDCFFSPLRLPKSRFLVCGVFSLKAVFLDRVLKDKQACACICVCVCWDNLTAAKAGLKLVIVLPPLHKSWDHRCVSPYPRLNTSDNINAFYSGKSCANVLWKESFRILLV